MKVITGIRIIVFGLPALIFGPFILAFVGNAIYVTIKSLMHPALIKEVTLSHDGNLIFIRYDYLYGDTFGNIDEHLAFYDVRQDKLRSITSPEGDGYSCAVFAKHSENILAVSVWYPDWDARIGLLDENNNLIVYPGDKGRVDCPAAFSYDGKKLLFLRSEDTPIQDPEGKREVLRGGYLIRNYGMFELDIASGEVIEISPLRGLGFSFDYINGHESIIYKTADTHPPYREMLNILHIPRDTDKGEVTAFSERHNMDNLFPHAYPDASMGAFSMDHAHAMLYFMRGSTGCELNRYSFISHRMQCVFKERSLSFYHLSGDGQSFIFTKGYNEDEELYYGQIQHTNDDEDEVSVSRHLDLQDRLGALTDTVPLPLQITEFEG